MPISSSLTIFLHFSLTLQAFIDNTYYIKLESVGLPPTPNVSCHTDHQFRMELLSNS